MDQDIYLVLSKTGTWLSLLIFLFSRIKYVHSSLSFDDSFSRMYSFGRINPDNPFSGGFVVENLYGGVYRRNKNSECVIYKVTVTEEQREELRRQIERFLRDKHHYRYNFLGLLGVWLGIRWQREKHYFCSQFLCEIMMNSGVLPTDKTPELFRTTEFHRLPNKEKLFEGYIRDLSPLVFQKQVV